MHQVSSLSRRLSAFSSRKLARDWSTPPSEQPWPALEGLVTILFTSRVGSTFLCQEIERNFAAKDISEAFNRPPLEELVRRHKLAGPREGLIRKIRASSEEGWFVSKAGVPGLLYAEHMGFFESYVSGARFLFLLRRDLLAQAISLTSAKLSGQFHSTQVATQSLGDEDFDESTAVKSVRNVVDGCKTIFAYLQKSNWPVRRVFYEDFSEGSFADVFRTLDEWGLPRRPEPTALDRPAVTRLGKDFATHWRARLNSLEEVRSHLAEYDAFVKQVEGHIRPVGDNWSGRGVATGAPKARKRSERVMEKAEVKSASGEAAPLDREQRDSIRAKRDQIRVDRDRLKEISRIRAELLTEARQLKAKLSEASADSGIKGEGG